MPARPRARTARVVGLSASLLGVLAVAGCQKPLPEVTVTSGGTSVSAEASRYCFGPGATRCRGSSQATTELHVSSTSGLSIDVPPSVASKGWYVVVNNQPRNQNPLHSHYVRVPLTATGLDTGRLDFQVVQAGSAAGQFTGEWSFTLVVG